MAYSSLQVANFIIAQADKSRRRLTQMQLQKLVYFCHGFFLAVSGQPLVEDPVEAWEYGTVFPKLREATKRYGRAPINQLIAWEDVGPLTAKERHPALADFSDDDISVMKSVWKAFGHFEAFKLSAISHDPSGPWAEVYRDRENRVIPNESIRRYFLSLEENDARQERVA